MLNRKNLLLLSPALLLMACINESSQQAPAAPAVSQTQSAPGPVSTQVGETADTTELADAAQSSADLSKTQPPPETAVVGTVYNLIAKHSRLNLSWTEVSADGSFQLTQNRKKKKILIDGAENGVVAEGDSRQWFSVKAGSEQDQVIIFATQTQSSALVAASTESGAPVALRNKPSASWPPKVAPPDQNWKLLQQTDGSYVIQNVAAGLVMEVADASRKAGAKVVLRPLTGENNQRWILNKVSPEQNGTAFYPSRDFLGTPFSNGLRPDSGSPPEPIRPLSGVSSLQVRMHASLKLCMDQPSGEEKCTTFGPGNYSYIGDGLNQKLLRVSYSDRSLYMALPEGVLPLPVAPPASPPPAPAPAPTP